jgi:hypothetical protein
MKREETCDLEDTLPVNVEIKEVFKFPLLPVKD